MYVHPIHFNLLLFCAWLLLLRAATSSWRRVGSQEAMWTWGPHPHPQPQRPYVRLPPLNPAPLLPSLASSPLALLCASLGSPGSGPRTRASPPPCPWTPAPQAAAAPGGAGHSRGAPCRRAPAAPRAPQEGGRRGPSQAPPPQARARGQARGLRAGLGRRVGVLALLLPFGVAPEAPLPTEHLRELPSAADRPSAHISLGTSRL